MSTLDLHVQCWQRVEDLPEAALALLRKAERTSIQLGPDWLAALQNHVFCAPASRTEAPKTRYFVLWNGSAAWAVWPLVASPDPRQGLQSLANYYCALSGLSTQEGCTAAQLRPLIDEVLRSDRSAASMTLYPLNPTAESTLILRQALRDAGYAVFEYHGFGNWVHEEPGSWSHFLSQRSANQRSNIRRALKRLAQAGASVEIITQPEAVNRGMAAFEAVYALSWKVAEPCPEFFRDLASRMAHRGGLRLGVVWLNGQAIAAQLWTVMHGVAEIHKLAYDERHQALGAGTALSAALFEHALDRDGVHKIDYLIGDDAYKAGWMNQRHERGGLMACHLGHARGLRMAAVEAFKRMVKRMVKHVNKPMVFGT